MSRIVKVPDIEHSTLCWKQKLTTPHAMTRCTFKKGHKGPHTWEAESEFKQCLGCTGWYRPDQHKICEVTGGVAEYRQGH